MQNNRNEEQIRKDMAKGDVLVAPSVSEDTKRTFSFWNTNLKKDTGKWKILIDNKRLSLCLVQVDPGTSLESKLKEDFG